MVTLNDLKNQLNDYLQVSLFNDYGPNGLQVEGRQAVRKVATAVTASLKVIEEAIDKGVDALIVHHGLFWQKDPYEVTGVKKEKLAKLLKHDISLLAYHLPLDAHREVGNNWKAALDLGWLDLEPFYPMGGQPIGVPIGVKGCFKEMPRDELKKQLERYYGQMAAFALGGKEIVKTAALISGGAYRQIEEAAAQGIDCFISGNFDEPAWHMAHEHKINFFALGHAATEKVGPKALAEHLRRTYALETIFIDEFNPF